MTIFLAFPFAGLCNKTTGEVDEKYRDFFEKLKKGIREKNHKYFLAHERENWGAEYKGPLECVPADYNGVKDCDFLIVIPGNPISGGVHIELGWASALKKHIHIFLEDNMKYSPVVMGLGALTNVDYHTGFEFPSIELLESIFNIVDQESELIKRKETN